MLYKWLIPISVAEWGEEIVLYQHQSGDTHLFSDVAKDIVTFCLSRECFSVTELIETERDYFNDQLQAEDFIASLVQSLIQKDLVVAETL